MLTHHAPFLLWLPNRILWGGGVANTLRAPGSPMVVTIWQKKCKYENFSDPKKNAKHSACALFCIISKSASLRWTCCEDLAGVPKRKKWKYDIFFWPEKMPNIAPAHCLALFPNPLLWGGRVAKTLPGPPKVRKSWQEKWNFNNFFRLGKIVKHSARALFCNFSKSAPQYKISENFKKSKNLGAAWTLRGLLWGKLEKIRYYLPLAALSGKQLI